MFLQIWHEFIFRILIQITCRCRRWNIWTMFWKKSWGCIPLHTCTFLIMPLFKAVFHVSLNFDSTNRPQQYSVWTPCSPMDPETNPPHFKNCKTNRCLKRFWATSNHWHLWNLPSPQLLDTWLVGWLVVDLDSAQCSKTIFYQQSMFYLKES